MKIEQNKYYVTRERGRAQAVLVWESTHTYPNTVRLEDGEEYTVTKHGMRCAHRETPYDLISPWEEPTVISRAFDPQTAHAFEHPPVDLSKVRKGMIAHFRCGVAIKIVEARQIDVIEKGVHFGMDIKFEGEIGGKGVTYENDGRVDCGISHPFDIIRLEEPPFDWKDVEAGFGFECISTGNTGTYVGPNLHGNNGVWLQSTIQQMILTAYKRDYLKRRPDLDIPKEK